MELNIHRSTKTSMEGSGPLRSAENCVDSRKHFWFCPPFLYWTVCPIPSLLQYLLQLRIAIINQLWQFLPMEQDELLSPVFILVVTQSSMIWCHDDMTWPQSHSDLLLLIIMTAHWAQTSETSSWCRKFWFRFTFNAANLLSWFSENNLNWYQQMPDFKDQIRFRLGLRPRPHWELTALSQAP